MNKNILLAGAKKYLNFVLIVDLFILSLQYLLTC